MGVQFTPEQQRVIDLRDCNILVSAAAGSGKTAVLVERIITRLTKDNPPLDVDQLLVATFTDAAASEMKERIHDAIQRALSENPEDEHLQRQSTLIHQARITTIHKFCLSVIREYFHTIDLDPGFRVGEQGEMDLLKRDVLAQVLEQAYEEANPKFLSFVENMASGKDDNELENIVLQLYDFASSHPKPDVWLDECVEQYDVTNEDDFEAKPFVAETVKEFRQIFEGYKGRIEFGIHICESDGGPVAYKSALESDVDFFESLSKMNTFGKMQQAIQNNKWATLGRINKNQVFEEKAEQVKAIRDRVKKEIDRLKKQYFAEDIKELCNDMQKAREDVEVLTGLVQTFRAAFLQEKRSKNLIDFDDMGHYALQILTKDTEHGLVPSEVAQSYQQKFAEVMIDEYQDVNYLQEAIMTSVSRVHQGKPNIFMVGDVKQSIYRFRMARPQLFLEKFQTYSSDGGNRQKVDLHKNFRSRSEVLDSTNALFEQLMIPAFGGIEYDDQAALHVGADYEERSGNETEVLLLDFEGINSAERMELEVEAIAQRIQELKETFTVKDKKTGIYREVRYSDIVILTKSPKSWNKVLSGVLTRAGIPTYARSKEGYFETQEIQTVLNYLKILDNPRQDIPFTSVLTSAFAGLSAEELALVKVHSEKNSMYERVLNYVSDGAAQDLKGRLRTFLTMFERFREQVPYTAIDELLWSVLQESGYGDYAAALPGGEQRAANLEMLIEKAVAFESTSYKGLFNFVRYIEQLKKFEIDYGEADLADEQAEVVRLMSIHQSKGLEFPIVILAGMGKEFNTQDLKQGIFIDGDWGIGIDSVDSLLRTTAPSFPKLAIKQKYLREMKAEELRVLYVAMTRAKEKLILVGSASDLEKRVSELQYLQYRPQVQLPYLNLIKANSYLDWVLAALLRNRSFSHVLNVYDVLPNTQNLIFSKVWPLSVSRNVLEDLVMEEAENQLEAQITKDILSQWDAQQTYDVKVKDCIEEQFTYCYPYEQEQNIKQKMSVSELKRQQAREEDGEVVYFEEEVIPLLPKFLREEQELTGASKGTAYHKVLELLDFTKDYDEESLQEELVRQANDGFLTTEMANCIRVKEILQFLQSDIGKRVQNAHRQGRCYAEQPFVLGLPAKEVYTELTSEELVLVQGIIDVYFEEEDGLVILDYKTDRVFRAEDLKDKYHAQLEYYAKALEQLTGKKVKEKVIYSFALLQEIEV